MGFYAACSLGGPSQGSFLQQGSCLPRKDGVSGAVFGLPLSGKLKDTDKPERNGVAQRIHYNCLAYHCRGSNCGQPANSTSSHCHQAEASTASIAQRQPYALLSWTTICRSPSVRHGIGDHERPLTPRHPSDWQHRHAAEAGAALFSSGGTSLEAQLGDDNPVGCQHERTPLITNNGTAWYEMRQRGPRRAGGGCGSMAWVVSLCLGLRWVQERWPSPLLMSSDHPREELPTGPQHRYGAASYSTGVFSHSWFSIQKNQDVKWFRKCGDRN